MPPPRLRIILVRHGESQNNIYHEISQQCFEENRVPDPGITELGQQQAQAVADYLKEASTNNAIFIDIDEIHVSPMRRTLQTAAPIVEALPNNIPVKVFTDIYEISGMHDKGRGHPGMKRSEMHAEFPTYQLPDDVTDQDGWYPTELGRETLQHGQERCRMVWERLVQMTNHELSQDKSIVMVCHGAFIDSLLQVAFGLIDPRNTADKSKPEPKEKLWVFPMWNTAITVLDIHNSSISNRPSLLFHNSVSRLASNLVKTDKLGKC